MDATRFDRLAKRFARRRLSRRAVLRSSGAGLAAAALGVVDRAAAQDATAPASSGTPGTTAGLAANNATLFVQTATAGTFQPNPQAAAETPGAAAGTPVAAGRGAYLLTLQGHSGATIAFSDRPQRNVGQVKTSQFFTSMDFTPANPPNAALVANTPQQAGDILLLELVNPAYDDSTHTLTYEADLLQHYPNDQGTALAPLAAQQQDQTIARAFTSPSLFIDDCADATYCGKPYSAGDVEVYTNVGSIPGGPFGKCWDWGCFCCTLCNVAQWDLNQRCNNAYPACEGRCRAL